MADDRDAPPKLDPLRLDLPAIHSAIRACKGDDAWMNAWLRSTYAAPARFDEALYAFAQTRRTAILKSRSDGAIDLHHDLALAHVGKRKTAIAAHADGAWVESTYESLHARAAALATAWTRAGVEPGQNVCIVAPVGVEYAAAIFTGFRLGLVVSALPAGGATFVRTRLEAIDPDRVAVGERAKPLVGRFAANALPLEASGREATAPTSHAYAPDEIAMRLVSPLRVEGPPVFDLPAERVHRMLLRDALLTYALDATDVVAAPGFDPLQHQPQLLLTTLAAGATWAEVDVRDLETDPRVLDAAHVTVLGVRRSLRALLVARGVEPFRSCRAWFRSMTDVLDLGWDELSRLFGERKVPGFQVLANAATGGAVLFGRRKLGALGLDSWPTAGETWQLSEVVGGTVQALNDSGALAILRDEAEDESLARFVLGRFGDAYVFSGCVDIGPEAQAYPCREVAAVAEKHPAVRHAAAFVTGGRWANDAKVVLLAFTEPWRDAQGRLVPAASVHEIRALVAREMGESRVPHRIEVFPLRPRMRKADKGPAEVDTGWCRSQYMRGVLAAKARSELFIRLAELSYIFAAGPPAE